MSEFIKAVSLFISLFFMFFSYPVSFLPSRVDDDFSIVTGTMTESKIVFNGAETSYEASGDFIFKENGSVEFNDKIEIAFVDPILGWFNYFGISYTSDEYLKGTVNYISGVKEISENFFLEPCSEPTSFYSLIDDFLDNKKANAIKSVTFETLRSSEAVFAVHGFSVFNRKVPGREVFIENENYKLGIDLLWGGALSYLEDKNSDVEAVNVNGKIKVDSNASERYNSEAVNRNVNLINRYDAGRLVQQSYYGTASGDYVPGEYMGNIWAYNPVQGGNQYNDSSKIVDLKVTENSVYVKCRPLDWSKPEDCITPSYMEATYEFIGNSVNARCRFTDFSGYNNTEMRSQEIPAFYCVEPLNNFVYYGGDKPWSNDNLTIVDDLIFWPDAGYPHYYSSENWSAFIGEFEDSFGIGIYVPGETEFLTGVFLRGTTSNPDPSLDCPTSYIAVTKNMILKDFEPFEYEFYLTTGNSSEIRSNFNEILK